MSALRGTGALVRLALRLDRVKLPVWIAGLALATISTASAFQGLYPDVASRQAFGATVTTNPALTALIGPLFDATSIGGLTAWRIGPVVVLAGLMGLQTVVRHTRAEEEGGRLELVGAAVVGRHAPLTAALLVALGAGLALAAVIAGGMVGLGLEPSGALALGLAVATTAWAFAAVAAVAAQVTSSARAANGIAGGVLALAYLLRALGDSAPEDTLRSGLSWVSPIGWSQQLRPFADERWWVLGVVAAFVAAAGALAFALRAHRDVDAGLVSTRSGPAAAQAWLGSPWGLAWRLQRATLLWWAVGFAVFGSVFGAVAQDMGAVVGDNPQLTAIVAQLGGVEALVDAFLAAATSIIGLVSSVFAVQATLRLRGEELGLRAEQVLATPVRRLPWAASHVVIAIAGTALLLVVAGTCAGLVHGLRAGDVGGTLPAVVGAALAQLPAALVLAGVALALFGALPRFVSLSWAAIAVTLLISQLGPVLQLDQWVLDLAPFSHVPQLPGAEMTWTPLVWLTVVAAASMAIGLVGLRRRDMG